MSYLVFTKGGTPAFLSFIFNLTKSVLYYIILSKLLKPKYGGIMIVTDVVKLFVGGIILLALLQGMGLIA